MTNSNETGVEGTELDNGQIVLNKAQMLALLCVTVVI